MGARARSGPWFPERRIRAPASGDLGRSEVDPVIAGLQPSAVPAIAPRRRRAAGIGIRALFFDGNKISGSVKPPGIAVHPAAKCTRKCRFDLRPLPISLLAIIACSSIFVMGSPPPLGWTVIQASLWSTKEGQESGSLEVETGLSGSPSAAFE